MNPLLPPQTARRVLVPGGYGLIGAGVVRALEAAGHAVTVAGRDAASAARVLPGRRFLHCDLARMTSPGDWACLASFDVVVNCAGALQDGPRDDLEAVHVTAIAALVQAAAAHGVRVVQISAAGVHPDASTAFLRSKAQGDAALLASGADVVILRPGLVLAQQAYGGSALLRLLAAVPLIQPLALPDTPIRTVGLSDLAGAVCMAAGDRLPRGTVCDLVSDEPHDLRGIVAAHRAALGFAPARAELVLPRPVLPLVAAGADVLGRLGWRSPLRSTALRVLEDGITGDPAPWRAQGGRVTPLAQTLAEAGFGAEHRLQARALLLMPLAVAVLVLFWALSGLIGLLHLPAAAAHLTGAGWPEPLARLSVQGWALVDLALAAALLWRPWARAACLGMCAVSLVYLAAATLVTPWLWADPLGPLVKVLPGLMLAQVTHSLLEPR